MSIDLEQRVAALESQMTDIKKLLEKASVEKDWRKTVGMSKDDLGFDEMIRLGREGREQQRESAS